MIVRINLFNFFIDLQNYLTSLNNLFEYLMPFRPVNNFNTLPLELPISIFIFLVFIKILTSKRMSLLYIILLLILPICAYILIDKIIIEKYYHLGFIGNNKLLFFDFFRLFFTSFLPYIIFSYLTFIIKLKTKVGLISYCLSIFYSSHIAYKLLSEFLLSIAIINKERIKIYFKAIKNDKKKIYFIYLIIYYLISHILNL